MILTVTPNPCVDKTVFIDRLEPGAFMRSQRCTCIPGGKGNNVARAVKAMGRKAIALTVVGGHPGAHVVEMIEQQDGVPCVPVWVASQTRTITTVLEESIHRQTAFFEPGSKVTPGEYEDLCRIFSSSLDGVDVVSFSGTVSDTSIARLYADLIPLAKERGILTILDTHGPELAQGLEAVPTMVKPNVAELTQFAGFALETLESRLRAIGGLHEIGIDLVVLSLGAEGALVSRGGVRLRAIPPTIDEINPVGSGDSLVAGFAIGLSEGQPLDAMARTACAMGTANAMNWDIGHFTRQQVVALEARVRIEPC